MAFIPVVVPTNYSENFFNNLSGLSTIELEQTCTYLHGAVGSSRESIYSIFFVSEEKLSDASLFRIRKALLSYANRFSKVGEFIQSESNMFDLTRSAIAENE